MTTLLITGGAGFIGFRIADAALRRGWSVRILDSLRRDVHGSAASVPEHADLFLGDIRDSDLLGRALNGVDAVCHQAAKVGLGVDFSDAPDYASTNDVGTATLLAAMARAGTRRLVLASSMVVYGEGRYTLDGRNVRPAPRQEADLRAGRFDPVDPETGRALVPALIDEDDVLDPRNVYAVSKLTQEMLCRVWARECGGAVAALRYHNVYGPGMPQNTPYAGVASLFRSALERGEAPEVFEDGEQRRDFIHVDDVAAANLAALRWCSTEAAGAFRAFNIGSGDVHTVGELAARLSVSLGGAPPVISGRFRAGDVRHITASSERARCELGWSPCTTFDHGVAEFASARLREAVS